MGWTSLPVLRETQPWKLSKEKVWSDPVQHRSTHSTKAKHGSVSASRHGGWKALRIDTHSPLQLPQHRLPWWAATMMWQKCGLLWLNICVFVVFFKLVCMYMSVQLTCWNSVRVCGGKSGERKSTFSACIRILTTVSFSVWNNTQQEWR